MQVNDTTSKRQLPLWLPAFLTVLMLALPLGGSASAQGVIGARLWGGPSWCFGSEFANVASNEANVLQPEVGAGVIFNFASRFRASLGYSYSQMVREQIDGTMEPLTGESILPGSVEGTVYRDFKTRFHVAGAACEYNLLPAGRILSLYAGTGAGVVVGTGNTWSLYIRNEMRSDDWTNTVSVGGRNESHSYVAPYIPATLSLECRILRDAAVCLGGVYRLVLSKEPLAPKSQVSATLGLRLDF